MKEVKKKRSKKLPVAISEEEFTKLLNSTDKMHHKVAFLLGFGAGMRLSEITSLQPNDIDFQEKQIRV